MPKLLLQLPPSWSSSDESVDALERAIAVLRKQAHDRRQASLVQLKTLKLIPDDAKKAIDASLQQDPDEGLAVSACDCDAREVAGRCSRRGRGRRHQEGSVL